MQLKAARGSGPRFFCRWLKVAHDWSKITVPPRLDKIVVSP
jgi:hypothetical protein